MKLKLSNRAVTPAAPANPAPVNIELPASGQAGLRRFQSVGTQHVLVSQKLEQTGALPRYLWKIEDLAGTVLGEVESSVSFSPFAVKGSVLLYVKPAHSEMRDGKVRGHERSIQALDLGTGELIWGRAIRETKYLGPFPV